MATATMTSPVAGKRTYDCPECRARDNADALPEALSGSLPEPTGEWT